jgi:hypothetical protein
VQTSGRLANTPGFSHCNEITQMPEFDIRYRHSDHPKSTTIVPILIVYRQTKASQTILMTREVAGRILHRRLFLKRSDDRECGSGSHVDSGDGVGHDCLSRDECN